MSYEKIKNNRAFWWKENKYMLILRIKYLQEKFFNDYLLLQNTKVKFFKQHILWKYRKLLIKLFEFPESIINWNSFEFELYALKNLINKYGYDV